MSKSPPSSGDELLARAQAIAGLRLAHLAQRLGADIPADLRRHKGWIGRLLESALGADGGNAADADFSQLGIELKTIPVDLEGRPRESTFVCSVPLARPDEVCWQTSGVRKKLSHVLWIPILAEPHLAVAGRMIGTPLLWSPSPVQRRQIADDWREHLDVIRRGYVDHITAHDGQVLQIRPKGASSDSRTWSIGPNGESTLTRPRAFYLRTSFTGAVLRDHFAVA